MKKTIITLLTLAGVAAAVTTPLTVLNDTYGSVIGGQDGTNGGDISLNVTKASGTINAASDYNTLTSLLTESNEWYVGSGTYNVGGFSSNNEGVILVAGGPKAPSASGAIKFSLSEATIAQYEGPITLSFDVLLSGGNNNKNHTFTFTLMNSSWSASASYNSKEGTNLLSEQKKTRVELTMNAEQVSAMQTAGGDHTFVLLAATNDVTGSNRGVLMNNFHLVPEPTTATLSLLALAGLAARRRRK